MPVQLANEAVYAGKLQFMIKSANSRIQLAATSCLVVELLLVCKPARETGEISMKHFASW